MTYEKCLEEGRIRLEKLRELEHIELQTRQEKLAQEKRVKEQAEREKRKKLAQAKKVREQTEHEKRNKLETDLIDGNALVLQPKISKNDLEIFENKLLSLCQEYFLDLSKSGISITSRSKDILKKYREKQKLSKFEEAYIHEYTLKSLSALLPDFQ